MNSNSIKKQETLKQSELLNTQTSAEEKENNSNLCDIRKVDESPFTIVRKNDEGEFNSFIAVGKNRLTGMMTEEECERLIEERDWGLITQLAVYVAQKVQEEGNKTVNDLYKS